MSGASADWMFCYQAADGVQRGPVSLEQMRLLVREGRVTCLTKIKRLPEQIWTSAIDVQELQHLFFTQASIPQSIEDKKLNDLKVGDLPAVLLSLAKAHARWLFWIGYIPNTLFLMISALLWVIMREELQVSALGVSLTIPILGYLWMIIAPPVAWAYFIREKLSFLAFVLVEWIIYTIGVGGVAAWSIHMQVSIFTGFAEMLSKLGKH